MNEPKLISAAKRKNLPTGKFALPEEKKYPVDTPARTRNAAARLEQNKASLSPEKYRKARAAIARAAKHFGIESVYNRKAREDIGAAPADSSPASTHAGAPPGRGDPARPIAGPKRGASIQGRGFRVSVSSHPGGTRRVEVHHMNDRAVFGTGVAVDLVALCEKIVSAERRLRDMPEGDERVALVEEVRTLSDEAAKPRWNQIAKVGRFLGHPAGPFELTPAVFDEIIRNFREVDGGKVKIDFEHASEADETQGSIPVTGAPAQGRVLDLQNRGEAGLWGLTEFFEPALSYVRQGKYDAFSPAIRFGAKHPETGKPIGARLTSVALVTRPFLRNLQPLAARDVSERPTGDTTMPDATKLDDKHPHEMMKALKACMGLHDLADMEDMKAHLDKLRDHAGPIADKPHGHAMGHVSPSGVKLGEYVAPMADVLGAPANMTTSQLLDAIEDLIDAAMEVHEVTEHNMADENGTDEKIMKLSQRLGALDAQVATLAAEKTVLSRDVEKLTLESGAKDAKIAELTAGLATSESTLTTLRDAEVKRVDTANASTVEAAFCTYKDTHRLSDAHRPMMLRELVADPANFAKLYPPVAANQQHLLRVLAGDRTPAGSTAGTTTRMGDRAAPVTAPGATPGPGASVDPRATHETQRLLADKLVKERNLTREQATSLAYRIASGQAEMPAFFTN